MAEPARAAGDRLPWLTEVPKSAPPPAPAKRKLHLPLLAFLLGILFALIAVGAFWLGSRPTSGLSTADAGSDAAERPGMTAQVDTAEEAEAQARNSAESSDAAANQVLAEDAESAAAVPETRPAATRATAEADRDRAEAARRAAVAARRTPARRRVASGDESEERAAAPVSLQPVVRGRIIQTGAYPSRAAAELAWQAMVKKWPYLATKPRLISPLDVRSTDGRATQMFRVQLATASQAQSVVICQRLTAAKQSCVVVY